MRAIRRRIWPRSKWRRALLVVFALLGGLAAVAWYQTRPARLTPRVERLVADFTGTQVHIDTARLQWGPRLVLDGVKLSLPDDPTDAGRLFEAQRVVIGIHGGDALSGAFTPRSVGVTRPIIYLTEDLQAGQYTFQRLRVGPDDPDQPTPPPPRLLPESFIDGGEVRIGQVEHGTYQPLGTVEVVGRLAERPGDDNELYAFRLMGREAQTDRHVTLEGQIDLDQRTMEVQLNGLTFDSVQRRFIPTAYRRWWDAMRPEGSFPRVWFRIAPDPQNHPSLAAAELQFDDLACSLPSELLNLAEDETHEIRMVEVTGVSRLIDGRFHDQFTGRIEGVRYEVTGTHGITLDEPFEITLATDPFTLAEKPTFFYALPPVAKKYHRRFSPSGKFTTTVTLERKEAGQPITTEGRVTIHEARATYKKFPYPCERITGGTITFTEDELRIDELVAFGPSGAKLVLNGTVTPPRDGAAVEIDLRVTDVPIDRHLTGAMEPEHREVLAMFFDPQRQAELIESGVIRAAPEEGAAVPTEGEGDAEAPPVFEPGGVIRRADIAIRRAFGEDTDYRVTTTLDVTGLRALYENWPYPLIGRSGELTIGPDAVVLDRIKLAGLTGGGGDIEGRLERPTDQTLIPQMTITDIRLPVDELLLASIPKPQDRWARDVHLRGELKAHGRIFQREDRRPEDEDSIDFVFDAKVTDATATPFDGRFYIEDVAGAFTLTRSDLTISELTGKRGEASLSLSGGIDWADGTPDFTIDAAATSLPIDPVALDLVPENLAAHKQLTTLFETHEPAGQTDLSLTWSNDGQRDRFAAVLKPNTLRFTLNDTRIDLSEMSGRVKVTPGLIELDQLAASFEHGRGQVSAALGLSEEPTHALSFSVQSDRLDATTRALLPPAVLTVIDGLALDGGYRIDGARLNLRPAATDKPTADFAAVIHLDDAEAQVGVPITDLDGQLGVKLTARHDQPYPFIDLDLQARRLVANGRVVEPMTLRMRSGRGLDAVVIREMRGTVYGGTLVGRGLITLGAEPRYAFDLSLHEAALEPFVQSDQDWQPPAPPNGQNDTLLPKPLQRRDDVGLLSAGLTIEAPLYDPAQRQGRGALEIRDARLFERPLSLALLQAANLSLPRASAFDRVSSRFLVVGDDVQFDSLSFDSPAVSITGSGTMHFPTRRLDLTMVNRNPAAWDLGPLNELYNTLKDELIAIRVRGTLDAPEAELQSFRNVRRTWDDLFTASRALTLRAGEYVGRE
jgi:hypothetical protein